MRKNDLYRILAWMLVIVLVLSTGISAGATMPAVKNQTEESSEVITEESETETDIQRELETETLQETEMLQETETLQETEKITEEVMETEEITEKTTETELPRKVARAAAEYNLADWISGYEYLINGKLVGNDYEYTKGDTIKFTLEYVIPTDERSNITAEDTLYYNLPVGVFGTFSKNENGYVYDSNYVHGPSGEYTIDANGRVEIQFYEAYLDTGFLTGGDFSFEGTLNISGEEESVHIELGNEKEVSFVVKTGAELNLAKSKTNSTVNSDGSANIAYQLSATAPATNTAAVTTAVIEDKFGAGSGYVDYSKGKITFGGYDYVSTSGGIDVYEDGTDKIEVDAGNKSFKWTIHNVESGTSRTLNYTTVVDASIWEWSESTVSGAVQSVTLKNTAKIQAEGAKEVTASAKLSKTWVSKSVSYDAATNKYKFVVWVNNTSPHISMAGKTIKDEMTTNGAIDGTVVLDVFYNPLKLKTADISETRSILANSDKKGFVYTFPAADGVYAYRFTYYVKDATTVSNKVTIDGKYSATASKNQLSIVKNFDKYEETDGYVKAYWTVAVTSLLQSGDIITDTLPNYYTFDSIKIYQRKSDGSKGNELSASDYLHTATNAYTAKIEIKNAFSNGVIIDVISKVSVADLEKKASLSSDKTYYKLTNTAKLTSNGVSTSSSATGNYYKNNVIGKEAGEYNPKDGTITWFVTLNSNGKMSGTVDLVDTLPAGLCFLGAPTVDEAASGVIYNGTTTPYPKLTYTVSEEESGSRMAVKVEGIKQGTLGKPDAKVVIRIVTKITDPDFRGTVSFANKASIVNGEGKELESSSATKQIEFGSLDKSSTISGSLITYTIEVNKEGQTLIPEGQSELYIVDEWSENIDFHRETLKVYVYDETAADGIRAAAEDEYALREVDTENRRFKLVLADGLHYKIVYNATVSGTFGSSVTVKNTVSFYGVVKYATSEEKKVTISKSSSNSTSAPNLSITKYIKNTENETLAGAEFTLAKVVVENDAVKWEQAGIVPAVTEAETKVTGDDGKSLFASLERETLYVFWESKTPAGYIENTVYHYIYITSGSMVPDYVKDAGAKIYQGSPSVEIDNERMPGSIIITKVSDQFDQEGKKEVLENAKFILYKYVEGEDGTSEQVYYKVGDAADVIWVTDELQATELVTSDQGIIKIDDLAWGIYYMKEVAAPSGYLLSQDEYMATIEGLEGTVAPIEIEVMNERIVIERDWYLQKVDGEGNALAGAQFTLTDEAGNTTTLISGADGKVSLDLMPGTYILTETKAPEGYVLVSTPTTLVVSDCYELSLGSGAAANISLENDNLEVRVVNEAEPPTGGLKDGVVTFNKKVVKDGKASAVRDTFYFTLFNDKELTDAVVTVALQLKDLSEGTVTITDLSYGTYYVAETDENGTPVADLDDFEYEVTISDESVTLTESAQRESVTVTNEIDSDKPTEKPTEKSTEKPKTPGTKTTTTTITRTGSGVKTGDSAQMMLYIGIMLATLLAVFGIVVKRKKQQ